MVELRADHAVRADEAAVAALDADVGLPDRHQLGDVALLEGGGAQRIGAVDRQRRDRQLVAAPGHHHGGDVAHELGRIVRHERWPGMAVDGLVRDLHLVQMRERGIDRREVLADHLAAFFPVRLLDRVLDPGDRLILGHDARDREEAGLHDGVDLAAHARAARDLVGVDHVKAQALVPDLRLDFARQVLPDLGRPMGAVEEKDRAWGCPPEHVDLLEEMELMTADEVGVRDQVGGADRLRPEAQVGDRARARLLGIVDEVALGVEGRVVADDLDRVLVGADGAIGAEPEEHGARGGLWLDVEGGVMGQAGAADIVADADREMVLRPLLAELVQHRLDHGGRELLGREPVTAADRPRRGPILEPALGLCLGNRRDHVEVERLAHGARLLGPVEHRDRSGARRQGGEEVQRRERPVEVDLNRTHPLASGGKVTHGLARGLRARAHQHDHPLGVRMAEVFEQPVFAAGQAARTAPSPARRCRARPRKSGSRSRAPGRTHPGSAPCRG